MNYQIRGTMRVILFLVSVVIFLTGVFAWRNEVLPSNYKFDHSLRFCIVTLLLSIYLFVAAIKGRLLFWKALGDQSPNSK